MRDLFVWRSWQASRVDVVGWQRDVVYCSFLRISVLVFAMDWIGADTGSDRNTPDPVLGVLLRDSDLEPSDAPVDVDHGGLGPYWHRCFPGNDHLWIHDDRCEHRLCGSDDRLAMLFSGHSQRMRTLRYLGGTVGFSPENLAL